MSGERLLVGSVTGLSSDEAERRLRELGPNQLPPPERESFGARLARHAREPMALLLVAAAGISGIGLNERVNAAAILAIVVLNIAIGLVLEGRANRAMEALRSLETPTAHVVRDGAHRVLSAREVVPGDMVVLTAGDRVPADLRLLETISLQADESLLTGESLPASKEALEAEEGAVGLGDQRARAFSGTLLTRGHGVGVVEATGPSTVLGRIATRLAERQPPTPLQRELASLTARLGTLAVVVSIVVFGLTVLRMGVSQDGLERSFLSAVALAVAAVPEGLATVVTIGLAMGVRRMAGAGAIIRRLPAVETLGSTTVLLTDKTGTITENRMRLEVVALPGMEPVAMESLPEEALASVLEVAVLNNDATLEPATGDPLEVALLEAAGPALVLRLRERHPRRDVIPFDSARRSMTTLHEADGSLRLLVKGAPERVLSGSTHAIDRGGRVEPLDEGTRSAILDTASELAGAGIRVLGLGRRELATAPVHLEEAERDLHFVALVGLRDAPRPEARTAVAQARAAGVSLVMVTGDHAGTARAIAEEVGLAGPPATVIEGAILRDSADAEGLLDAQVYARVDPEQKLQLVEAFRARGDVVAVTGDGVNDAPALKRADIGVAMGRSGSDVAREAADLVITDDNLATIVAAIREGRGIYDNIRKVVDYLVAGNLSEILVVVSCLLLFPGLGIPLLPLQLLWVNLLTDGLPALALGVEPADPDLMRRPPRPASARLFSTARAGILLGRALMIAGASVASLTIARFAWHETWGEARALMFTVLVLAHLLYAFAVRRPGAPSGRWLPLAVGVGIALQLVIVVWPAAHEVFATASLGVREWTMVLVGGTLPVMGIASLEVRSRRRPPAGRPSGHPGARSSVRECPLDA
jgi:P-type Ca2+ transporter type 2C